MFLYKDFMIHPGIKSAVDFTPKAAGMPNFDPILTSNRFDATKMSFMLKGRAATVIP